MHSFYLETSVGYCGDFFRGTWFEEILGIGGDAIVGVEGVGPGGDVMMLHVVVRHVGMSVSEVGVWHRLGACLGAEILGGPVMRRGSALFIDERVLSVSERRILEGDAFLYYGFFREGLLALDVDVKSFAIALLQEYTAEFSGVHSCT